MLTRRYWVFWIVLLLVAMALRLPGVMWDDGIAAHPDERFLLGVAQQVPLGQNPCLVEPEFAYGHLPLFLAQLATRLAPEFDPLLPMRLVSGLLGILLVVMAGAWGQRLMGSRAGLFAAAVVAVAPFPLQLAQFYTVDPLGAVLASAAVLAVTRQRWAAAGAFAGLALACKASLVWVGVPLFAALLFVRGEPLTLARPRLAALLQALRRALLSRACLKMAFAAFVAFVSVSPWALLDPVGCWRGPWIQAGMAVGRYDFPYTRQYAGTLPYLYPLTQMALWGLGPAVTLMGLLGLLGALRRWNDLSFKLRVAVVWTVGYFAQIGALYVKFPRYLLPLYPIWAAWASMVCVKGVSGVLAIRQDCRPQRRWVGGVVLVLLTAPLGLAQISLYAEPHPWTTASRWLYQNMLPGETLAVEMWDHPLPVPLPKGDPEAYTQITLPIFDPVSSGKRAQLDAAQAAEVIILASRRGYGALSRQPQRYAEMLAWYQHLLVERDVIAFGRCPHLGPLALTDDPLADAGLPIPLSLAERCGTPYALRLPHLDESFRVYDGPIGLFLLQN